MSFPFNRRRGLVIVFVRVHGPSQSITLRLALDTGASDTLISADRLEEVGFDFAFASETVELTTGDSITTAPILSIPHLEALGQTRVNFPVVVHNLPPTATVDGVLGLDFLRQHRLTLDFRLGQLTLE